uniref:BlaI/MecI/CopY family transcriptional regulator n=1 Tax=Acetatifactor sp. TaxID=1872090 RepID=UPI004055B1BB
MKDYTLADVETKFAELIWNNEPITSSELVKLCAKELNWKKSTTYTVLKKLSERGIFRNDNSVITSKLSREEFYGMQSQKYVEQTFGSLPKFLTAFFNGRKLSQTEAEELRKYIDQFEE